MKEKEKTENDKSTEKIINLIYKFNVFLNLQCTNTQVYQQISQWFQKQANENDDSPGATIVGQF